MYPKGSASQFKNPDSKQWFTTRYTAEFTSWVNPGGLYQQMASAMPLLALLSFLVCITIARPYSCNHIRSPLLAITVELTTKRSCGL